MFLAVILVLLVAALMLAVGRWRADAFLTLLSCAFLFGLSAGMGVEGSLEAIKTGFGNTLGGIGIVVILGAVIGVFLERSGASGSIAAAMLRLVGQKRTGLSLNLTGYIVSIPVFCDSGFIILVPLVRAMARRTGISRLALAVALATGLYSTHCLVPPTPGPIGAAQILGADLGRVILLGLPVALALSLIGWWWSRRFENTELPEMADEPSAAQTAATETRAPGTLRSALPIVVPLLLITLGSVITAGKTAAELGKAETLLKGFGHPVFALAVGVILSLWLARRSDPRGSWIIEGIKSTAIVLAVTAAGGAFGQVIRTSALGKTLQDLIGGWQAGVLVPFLLAAALKSAQGSSTVAMITSAAIIQPLLGALGLATPWGPALDVTAIGCGAMTVSHANDSFFWVVSQMGGIPAPTAYRVYTVATGIMGFCGAAILYGLSLVL
ncbi:GntP family permease [bacterium]|nr:GntP family permease [bacterium]